MLKAGLIFCYLLFFFSVVYKYTLSFLIIIHFHTKDLG